MRGHARAGRAAGAGRCDRRVDDYPSRLKSAAQDSLVDPWNFYNRECTSFVAWRLNNDAGIAFHNWYQGHHWGDAAIWKRAALDSGVPVDGVAARGAIAWWAKGSPGSSGHVAWVIGVTSSSITVEEYNYVHPRPLRPADDLDDRAQVAQRVHPPRQPTMRTPRGRR